MHLLRTERRLLDEAESPVELALDPADVLFFSLIDNDLALCAQAAQGLSFSVRAVPLSALRHPYSLDKTVENLGPHAKAVIMRLLGGREAAPYAVDEWRRHCQAHDIPFILLSGEPGEAPSLTALSMLCQKLCARLQQHLDAGGVGNLRKLLAFFDPSTKTAQTCLRQGEIRGCCGGVEAVLPPPQALAAHGLWDKATRPGAGQRATLIFYRTALLADDTAPVLALADALAKEGLAVEAIFVPSLKEPEAARFVSSHLAATCPDIVLTTTAFAARQGDQPSPLEAADAPILQVILAGASFEGWLANPRGLSPTDLAMNVVLPEVDGRIITRPVSFKAERALGPGLPPVVVHAPDEERVAFVAKLAANWARLRHGPINEKRLGLIVPDYPGRGGRQGFAVGLDTGASLASLCRLMGHEPDWTDDTALMAALSEGEGQETFSAADYRAAFAAFPESLRQSMVAAWGEPSDEDFKFRIRRLGPLMLTLQPDRGRSETRRADYHDTSLPPCHSYAAFYALMRRECEALVHLGTHGTLEWLPGKAVALSSSCAPEALLGATPLIAPFIVNNPGEAAQARRRTAALTLGHLTPPLVRAGAEGDVALLEALFDEYASAEHMDPKRAKVLAERMLEEAGRAGLLTESGADQAEDEGEALSRLDAFLCDVKDMRVGDGLHVFGVGALAVPGSKAVSASATARPSSRTGAAGAGILVPGEIPVRTFGPPGMTEVGAVALEDQSTSGHDMPEDEAHRRALSPAMECEGFLRAVTGRFVPPGPAGAPSSGRLDVLPTGRSLYACDPRALPTQTGWDFGHRNAKAFIARYVSDHGDYPRRLVMDLWGSSSMRTGGEDLAQAFALLGVKPVWEPGSLRVTGIDVLPLALLDHPRVDVTLRVSGLARDIFGAQIALFAMAVQAVAGLDEEEADNPLSGQTELSRVFGAAAGSYGLSLTSRIDADDFVSREELGAAYAGESAVSQDGGAGSFADRLKGAQALLHLQDLEGQDVLSGSAFAAHEGGFAASAPQASVYHLDASVSGEVRVRTLAEEVARAVRGRLAHPRWIAGQMRHGHRGAAEIADGLDNLHAFAALSDAASSRHFDLVFDATLGNEDVRAFLERANPQAYAAMKQTFRRALTRGYWQGRRNAVGAVLWE